MSAVQLLPRALPMALLQQWGICPVLLRLPLPRAQQVHLLALRTSPVQWAPTSLQVGDHAHIKCMMLLIDYVMHRFKTSAA